MAALPAAWSSPLIVTKILAGRPKDLEAEQGILRERLAHLDLGLVRDTLAELESALSQNDLRPAFDAALARVTGAGR